MPRPRTIHDFYGFPRALFEIDYAAPGLPELAEEVADVVAPTWVGADLDSWGIDHGTWSVLVHAFPQADIPVVQLSINETKPPDYHLELGAKLAPLRESGVLVLGSGNIVHNLAGMQPRLVDDGFDWARRFDDAAHDVLLDDPAAATRLTGHPDFRTAAPTTEHFVPMLYLAGLAAAGDGATDAARARLRLRLAVDGVLRPRRPGPTRAPRPTRAAARPCPIWIRGRPTCRTHHSPGAAIADGGGQEHSGSGAMGR